MSSHNLKGFQLSHHRSIPPAEWHARVQAALTWLRRSMAATGRQGSAHSFALHRGWAPAYPETTGYLIETLLDYSAILKEPQWRERALECAQWLISIQLDNGAFSALTVGNSSPSIFNTAQILFGLSRAAQEWPERSAKHDACMHALERAALWLLQELDDLGAWPNWAYVPGFIPSYYTRAVWGMLEANKLLKNKEIEAGMRRALGYYQARFEENATVRDWGFWPGKPAFTHTIAYTLEGFLESALLLEEPEIVEKTRASLDRLIDTCERDGRTAGWYDLQWKGNHRFICCTGNAQLSILCRRFGEITGEPRYHFAQHAFLFEILDYQSNSWLPGLRGAFPGSVPMWGPYLPFRYPNWGVKFFLEAMKKVMSYEL